MKTFKTVKTSRNLLFVCENNLNNLCLLLHRFQKFAFSVKTIRPSTRQRYRYNNRELKQTDAAAAILQISIQKDSRASEFSRPLTSITLNLNGNLPVDRRRVSLLKLSNIVFKAFHVGDRFQKLSFSVKTIIVFDRFRVDHPV